MNVITRKRTCFRKESGSMPYKIVRDHYLLYETIELLFRFTNNMSYRSLLSLQMAMNATAEPNHAVRQAEELQCILEETCLGLSPQDPQLQRYFGKVTVGGSQENTCLARLLVFSFFTLKNPDFWENIEEIRKNWWYLQQKGAWIQDYHLMGLEFTFGGCCPGDIFEQVCRLNMPAEFQMLLCRALRNFDEALDELAELIFPVAERLKVAIRKLDWLLEEKVEYWENSEVSPLQYLEKTTGQSLFEQEELTVVAVFVMNSHFLLYKKSDMGENISHVYLGSGASVKSHRRDQNMTYEMLSLSLKALGDKKRLEIIGRLSKSRAYSLELSEAVGMDPSNMSRTLTQLCNYGFLRQKKEGQKNYYETDKEALRQFLRHLESALLN